MFQPIRYIFIPLSLTLSLSLWGGGGGEIERGRLLASVSVGQLDRLAVLPGVCLCAAVTAWANLAAH